MQSSGSWTTHDVSGHAVDVYVPPRRAEQGYGLLYLHGVHLEPLRDKPAFLDEFDRRGLLVISPQCGPTWWSDRVTPHFDANISVQQYLLEELLPYAKKTWELTPPRIGLLGTSMGGQGALRLAYKFPDTFPVVSAIAPAIDYQLRIREGDEILLGMYGDEESARQDTALLHIHPLYWPRHQFFCCDPLDQRWFDSVDRLRMKLGSLGVPFEYDLDTSGGGHGFAYYDVMARRAIDFLVDRLDQERRRLV
ncbi:MAG: hypothetical protein KDA60_07545 [Planctomycetales bacterium]|nr:hypothetical protein [Planctomycetales bacterium]